MYTRRPASDTIGAAFNRSRPGHGPWTPCAFAIFGALVLATPVSLPAQPAPTVSLSIGMQGYKDVKQPEGGLMAELTGGVEWVGRTRIEVGTTATMQPGDCAGSTCDPWHVESLAAFGEVSRLLGERDAPVRFVLATRAGYERLLTWDRDGFAVAGRMGGEFGLGRRAALSVMGFAGWATFEEHNPVFGSDFTGPRLGLNIGIRIHPGAGTRK